MTPIQEHWIKVVRAILIVTKLIRLDTKLHTESWLVYQEAGYKPSEAVNEDMGCIVKFSYTDLAKQYDLLQ